MADTTNAQGKVVAISGQILAVSPDGSRRILKLGDSIAIGERLLVADGAYIEVQGNNGNILRVADERNILFTEEVFLATEDPTTTTIAPLSNDTNAVLAALAQGQDPLQALEATAAGLNAGAADDGGISFVRIARVAETIQGLTLSSESPLSLGSTLVVVDDDALPDTTPPALTVALDPASDSGTKGDGITNDSTPTIGGAGEPGNTITITTPTGESITTTVKPDGTWTATPTQPLPDGNNTISVKATDPAGNSSTSSVPVTVDTTPPAITAKLDPSSDSGTQGDGITNDNTPTISGTGSAGDTITITTPTGESITTTVKPDGTWTATPTQPLPDGNNTISVKATDPAGNSSTSSVPVTVDTTPPAITAKLDPASDSGTKGDGVTNDNTPTISGTGSAGDTITITTPTGESITTTVKPDGTWTATPTQPLPDGNNTISVKATDPAGNSSTSSVPVTVDTTPPAVTAQLDPASDSGTPGDGITNDNTPTLSGTGEPGNTITVTSPTGEVMTTTVKPDGTWSVTPTQPLPDGAANFPVTATDPAGNTTSSNVPVTIDSAVPNAGAAPTVTITEDANNDGFINASESQGPVDLKVAFDPNTVAVGDTVKVTANGVTQDVVISAADKANGYVTATTPLPAQDTMLNVSAVIVDAAGNSSAPGTDSAKVDRSDLSGVSVSITEDANNDGVINQSELQGSVGVTVTLPAGAIAGDLLTVTANGNATQAITLTPAQIAAGQVIVELQAPASGSTLTVSAQVTDAAGNQSNVASDSARIDTTAPALTAQLNPSSDSGTPGDGITNDNTPTISGTGEPGNTITVTSPTGEVLTTTVKPDGTWSVTPTQPLPDGAANFPVTATDPAGNSTSSSVPVTIDTTPPAASITLNSITADNVINATEAGQQIPVTGSVGGDAKAGDTVTLTVNGKTFTGTVAADKTFSINVPGSDLLADPDTTVDASVTTTDAAGNSRTVSTSEGYSLGTPPTLTAQLDPASDSGKQGDGITSDSTPTISGTTTPGATVSVSSPTGEVLTTTAGPDGTWSVTPTQPLPNGAANFPVTATSPAGDVTSTTVPVTIDTTAPTLTAKLDPASDSGTQGDGITNDNTPTLSGTGEPGNTITVTSPTGEVMTTTVKPDGTWSVTPTQPLPDGAANFPVTTTDPAGNSTSSSVPVTIDSAVPNAGAAPTVTITEDANNDGYINASEASGPVDLKVAFDPNTVTVGDTVKVTANGVTQDVVISAADKANGYVTATTPLPANGSTLDVSAVIVDAAGNSSLPGSDSAIVDTTALSGLGIQILEDENNDGYIVSSELKDNDIDVRVTLPADAAVGDTLTVSGSGNTHQVFTLTAAQLAAGFIDVSFNPTADRTTFVASAQLTDAAGNQGGPVQDSATIVVGAPGAPIVVIGEDANNDGYINAAELQGPINASVILPATAKAGDTLQTSVNGVAQAPIVLTAADISNGSVTLPGIANPGEGQTLTVTAQVSNPAGIAGASGSDSAIIDTTPPAASVTLNANITPDDVINAAESKQDIAITGSVGGDAKAGDTVTLTVNGKTFTGTVAADKTFSIPVPGADLVADSDKTIDASVTTTDAAGNSTTATASEGYSVDTTAPTLTAVLDPSSDSGTPGDGITNDNTPTLSGTGEPGNTITVTSPTGEVMTTTVKPDGTWSVTPTQPLPDGAANFPVIATDPAGNSTSSSVPVTIDTTPPAASVTLNANITPDDVINAAESKQDIAITGSVGGDAKAGDTVTLTVNGKTFTGTVAADKTFSIPVPGADLVADSDKTIDASVTTTDAAGNSTTATASEGYSVDITAPTLTAQLDPASDSGTPGDGITNDNTPTISGTGEPGNTITVTTPVGETLTTTVKPDGTWSVTPTQPLPDGAANFPVTATDPAGNSTSSSVPVTIDTTPPAASITLNANITPDDVINAAESKQDIAITGSVGGDAKAGDTVTLTVNGKTFTGTVAADKTFSIPVPGADLVADSDKTIDASVTTTDAAGNSSTATASEGYSVDTTAPTLTAKLDPASDSGTQGDGLTNDNTPTLSGTGEPGNTITVTSPTGEVMTTTVKPDGTWSVTPTQPLPDGAANFPVTATDPAGNTTSSSVPVTIDSAVPNAGAAPTVTITEDANNDGFINASESQGPVDLKVAFDPNTVAVGDTVKVTANGVTQDVVISAADKANGYVTATTPLPAQDTMLNVSAVIVDAAGNSSAPGTDSAKVDRSDLSGVGISITEDANNDGVINQSELQGSVGVTVTLPAGAIAGDLLTVTANGNATQAITLTPAQIAAGQVTVELQAPASGSTLNVSAQVTDAAGNQSNVASDSARIDTTPPTVTAKLDPASDSGTQGDGITNDNTPTISGTGEPGNTITVTSPTGEVMTTTVKPDGTWSVTPTQPLPDGAANFPVTATDPAGNSTSSSVPVTIDTTPPAASITLNSITADNVINATEAGQQIPVTGSVGGDAKAGDTVTLTVNGKTFTGTVAADKTFSINVPGSDLLADPDTTVDASVTTTDAAGNSTTVSDSEDYSLGTPPTLTALLDPASDSGKQGDGITSDSTPTISGTTTPGATVSVSSPTGEVLTTTAGPDGTWSITPTQPLPNGAANFPVTATSPAGDVTSTTVPVTIDTTAPTLTAKLDPASDSGTQGDGITNDNTPTLSGTGEPGNTITVTTPVGETLTTTVKPDGTWSVTPTQPLPDGAANFPVTATDPAGNSTSSSVPVTIDSAVPNAGAAPTVTITEDANNDGYINASEASGPVDLKVAFDPNTVAVGDTVKVTANGVTQDVVISAADKANGYVTATTPLPANGSTLDVSAVIVDAAGNSSLPGSDSAIVDTTALSGLGIQILEDENNDGYIVSSELKDNDIDVRVTLPADAAVGDTLTVSGSGNTHQVFTLTAAQLAAGFIDVSFNPTADRTTFVASAQLTDAAGNQGGPVQDSATIVVGAPGAPIVVIGEDANNDGYINAAELQGPINASVILPATAKAGDTLQTSVNGVAQAPIVLTAADISNGSVTLPGIANPGEGQTLTVTAQVSNPAGIAGASGSDSAIIDTTPPAASVTLNANITPDDVINAAESKQDIAITGSVGGDVKAGDTVTLTVNGKTFTGTVAADKTFSIPVPGADLVADSDKTIDASVTTTDAAGNSTTATASEGYSVDTTAPTLTAQLDPASDSGTPGDGITNDNTPTISGTGEPGNTITVTTPVGETLTTTVKPDGTWSVTPTQPLPDGAANFPVTATDPAGNSTSSSVPVTIDTTPPAASVTLNANITPDDVINAAESKQDIAITGSVGGDAKAGDTVTLTVNGKTFTGTVAADKTFSIPVPGADLVADSDKTIDASVTTTDAAGNSSTATASEGYSVDTTAPTLTAQLDPASDSGTPGDGITNDNTPTISGTGEPGNTITVTTPVGETLTTTVKPDGTWSVTPTQPLPDGAANFPVTATDPAGNSTSSSVPVTIDTTLPAASVTLNANITPDDVINAAESKQDIAITGSVGGDAKAGDTVTLTVNGKTFTGTVAADKTFSIPVPGADLVADSDKTIDASVTTTDAAGNSSTATASEGYSVDTTAPTLTAQLDPASDSGTPGDGITNDNTPTISGTGEPGNTITVTTPVGETLTTTVKPDGTWSVTPTQPLPDGAANFPVTATDPAGNSTSSSVPVTIDTTAPALTAVLDPASDSGKAGDGITSDTTPTISGTGEPGNSIQVTMPGTGEVLTTTVGPDGKWSVTPTQALPEGGPQTVSVLETDPAGVTSTATVPVTIDTTAPTLTAVLDPASDSGKAGDGITSDTTPTISGTGEPGNSIQVTMPGTGEVLTTTVGLDGKWSVTPTQALPEGGPQTVSVLETDPAGVTSTATVPVTIDTTPPLITVSAPDNSNDSTPTITGTSNVPAGTVVTLVVTDSAGTVQTLSATVQAGGSYSVDVPVAMPDGNFTVSASVVDPAGNPASASDNGSLDALAGAITVQATVDNANRQLDISGSTVDVAPGQQVALKIQDQSGHVINTTAIVQPDGSYSLQDVDVSSLQDGTLTTTASAIDRNGATRVANDLDQLDVFNTAPVNTVPGAQSLLEDGSRVISGLAISDPDAGSGYLTVTLNVSNGVLNVLAGPAVISGSGTGSVVLSGTVAMINATLAAVGAVTYAPAANYNGSDSLTMTTLDNGNTGLGGPLSDTDTVAITVTSVNDAPNGADKTIQLSEGGIYTFKLSDFGFTDPNDTPANGFLNVTINTIPVNGTLFLDSDGDGMYSSGEELPAGQLVAASAINSGELKYYSALGNTVDDTFDFSVRDNGGTANGGKNTDPVPNRFTMDVVPLPVVTVNAPDNTNDSTPTLSGTSNQPAGSIVTITVTDSTGAVQTLSATVQTNGTYSVDVPSALAQGAYTAVASSTNVLGDSTTASDNGSVDSIPPVLTAKLDPSSDSGTVGDGVTNDNTPTISGTGEPGSTIQVTMPGTNEVLTTNVGPDGKWSVTPTQALPEGGPQTVAVKETDSAGNSTNATVPITVDTLPPPLVAKLDPASDSGVVGDGITNDNTPTISGSGTPGDIITVTMPTGEVLTTTVKPDGSWSVTPTQALPDGAISIPVTATDPAGNITSSSVPVTIDTTPPVPTITLNPNVTADDIINASEATQPVPVTGSVGGDAKAGDIVTLTVNGKTFTGTVQADKTFSINVPGSDLVADTGKTITASVTTTDDAGNPGSASSSDSYNVDTTAPNSSTTSITVDNVTADNVINAAEATQSIPVSGKVTGEFKAGDVVTLLVNGSSYQTTVDAAGNYSVNVAGSDLKADTSIDATVAAHDAAGNVGDVSTVHSHSVDTTPPVPTITLNPNLTADDIINASEATQPIPVTGSVGGDAKAGDIVTLTVNGKTFTGTVQADKTFSINVPGSDLVADTGKTITASVTTTDAAGNPGSASTSDSYSVDTTAPNSTTTSITVDNVTADNIINAAEAAQAIPVSGKVTGEFKVGDVVTLQVNGNNYQTTVDAAGNYSVNVAGSDLKADTTIDAKVAATDPAGNVGDVSTVHSHSVQINIAPTANPDNAVVVEAGGSSGSTNYYAGTPTATGNVLGNDTVTDTGGTKTLTVVNGQTISGSTAINGVYGTLTIAADGSYSYALDNTKTATNLLAKGAVVNEVFNYTMQDGKGLSSSSQLTVQVSGTNDAPTFTTLQPIEKLFPTVASSYGNLIDITPIDGTPKMGVAPTGWNITRNTPDLTLYNPDGVTKVQYADSTAYKVYGVKGSSLDGGAALGLFNVVSSGYTEGVHTVLYNLEAGKTYTIGFEWQKMITVRWQGLYNQYSYGGAFKITSSTGQTKTFTQSALSQDDAWQLASFTFVATGINEIFTIESVIVPAPGEVGTDSLQSVIVDSLNATNLQTLLATANSTGAKLSELMSDAVAIDSGDSIKGYAITSAAQTSAGYWEYNNGSSWVNLGALGASAQNAVFLTADTALRWNGASTSTALSMVAVDTTDTQFTGVGSVGDVSVNGGSTAYSAPVTLAATRYGTSQIDNLVGDDSNNQLLGLAGNDTLNGGLGDDYLDGGKGADTLIGGTGKDTFVWHFGDGGSPGTPVRDTINDFNRSEGDVLDLRDLLKNESASNLTQYLHFTASGSDTLVQVSSLGSFNGSNYATVVDQEILLKGVALSSLGSTDTAIINELLKNNLKVDGM